MPLRCFEENTSKEGLKLLCYGLLKNVDVDDCVNSTGNCGGVYSYKCAVDSVMANLIHISQDSQ